MPADLIELELLRAGHRIAWRAADRDELLEQLAADTPDVVLVADDPAVASLDVVGAGDLLGVRTCLVRVDDATSASARLLGVHDVLRVVPGRAVDLSVLRAPFDALDGGIEDSAAASERPIDAAVAPFAPTATSMHTAPTAPTAPRLPAEQAAPGSSGAPAGHGVPPAATPRAPDSGPLATAPPARTRRHRISTRARARLAQPSAPVPPAAAEALPTRLPGSAPPHRVIAVWGPAGAPGRTLIATTLAAELASRGLHVCLIDADTYGGTIAPSLGLLDEAPGFAAACRLAASDALDASELERVAVDYGGSTAPFRVLTGIGRPHRWPELARDRVVGALEQARQWCDAVVVDVGFNLETDEELSSDLLAPRRNAATIAALRAADEVVAVGAGDPVGLTRLLRTHADLLETVTIDEVHVVVNRVRSSVLGVDPAGQVRQTLDRFGGIPDPLLIPDDPAAADAALLGARTVVDAAPRSPLRQGVAALADRLGYGIQAAPRRRAWGLLRGTG